MSRRKKSNFWPIFRFVAITILVIAGIIFGIFALIRKHAMNEERSFKVELQLLSDDEIRDQGLSRLCWAFGGVAMLENELARKGMDVNDLSEAFVAYYNSIDRYMACLDDEELRWNQGGCMGDMWAVINKWGIVPDSVMPCPLEDSRYVLLNDEMAAPQVGLLPQARSAAEVNDKERYDFCIDEIVRAINRCFGEPPQTFVCEGDTITPKQYAERLGITEDNYIQITSSLDDPFYDWCVMDFPDHWRKAPAFNVPLDTLMAIIDRSLALGHTLTWDGDISENGFRWHFNQGFVRLQGRKEPWVSPERHQRDLNWGRTTDDHLMLICGLAKDSEGNDYYIMKNSWGQYGSQGEVLYVSKAYVRSKVVMITVNKAATRFK